MWEQWNKTAPDYHCVIGFVGQYTWVPFWMSQWNTVPAVSGVQISKEWDRYYHLSGRHKLLPCKPVCPLGRAVLYGALYWALAPHRTCVQSTSAPWRVGYRPGSRGSSPCWHSARDACARTALSALLSPHPGHRWRWMSPSSTHDHLKQKGNRHYISYCSKRCVIRNVLYQASGMLLFARNTYI